MIIIYRLRYRGGAHHCAAVRGLCLEIRPARYYYTTLLFRGDIGSDCGLVELCCNILLTCYKDNHFIPIVSVEKRGAYSLVHGDLPRQHSFGTTLRFTGPVQADSPQ